MNRAQIKGECRHEWEIVLRKRQERVIASSNKLRAANNLPR